MSDYKDLFKDDPSLWIEVLPKYQKDIVLVLLSKSDDYEEVASIWLNASPQNTYPYGAQKTNRIFLDKLLDEIEAFLCGDIKYKNDISKLLKESKVVHTFFVSVMSAAIAPSLGVSGAVLAPVIVIILTSVCKVTLNAWIEMRKESRNKQNKEGESNLDSKLIQGT